MASSPFNISQAKLNRIATFSQFFSLNKCGHYSSSNNIICLPRKLRPRISRNLHFSVHRYNDYSPSSSSSCQLPVDRNLCCYSQRRHVFDANKNPEPESEEEGADNSDHEAIDPLFKFFAAITHRFITPGKSEFLADQWPLFVTCFLSFLQALQRRKRAWGFFSYLIQVFGDNIEFVFKETLSDGLNIGVQWKFESKELQFPIGKGFGFYISHSYKGKAMIRNSETFIKPLLHLLPFRLKIMASLEGLRECIGSFMAWESEDRSKKILSIVIALSSITALFFLSRIPSFKLVLKLSHKP